MAYSYDSLGDYLIELGDACINSTMDLCNMNGSTKSGWEGMNLANTAIRISPLGGAYVGSTFVGGGQVTDAITGQPATFTIPGNQGWPFHDLPSMVDYYQTTINDLFSDFWQIPFPSNYAAPMEAGRSASAAIALLPAAGRDGFGATSEPWSVEGFGSNESMRQIDWISGEIGDFGGDAIEDFNRLYMSQLPLLATGQQYMTSVLWAAAGGQKEMWLRARQAVAETAGKAGEAAKAANGGGGGGFAVGLKILGAALSLGTIVVTGGTAGAVIAGGATITGVLSSFVPESESEPKPELGAETPVGVLANVKTALDDLKKQLKLEEQGQVDALQNAKTFVTDNLPSFDFAAPGLNTETDAGDVRDAGRDQAQHRHAPRDRQRAPACRRPPVQGRGRRARAERRRRSVGPARQPRGRSQRPVAGVVRAGQHDDRDPRQHLRRAGPGQRRPGDRGQQLRQDRRRDPRRPRGRAGEGGQGRLSRPQLIPPSKAMTVPVTIRASAEAR